MKNKVKSLLSNDFGIFELTELSGGYNNMVCRMDCAKGSFVIKASDENRKGLLTEYRALNLLSGTGIAPEPMAVYEDGDFVCEVMPLCNGKNAQSLLDAGDVYKAKRACYLLGKVLSAVHMIKGLAPVSANDVLPVPDFVPDNLKKTIESRLTGLSGEFCLTHGDFGLHNAIYDEDNDKIALIDWEWALGAPRGRDYGWFEWFLNLHYENIADELYCEFLKGYSMAIETSQTKAAIMYQVASILRIAANAPDEETRIEWLRRLDFTLENF